MYGDRQFLTRQWLVDKSYRRQRWISPSTVASVLGLGNDDSGCKRDEDSVIKTLGRWKSSVYLQHVQISRQELAHHSKQLSS